MGKTILLDGIDIMEYNLYLSETPKVPTTEEVVEPKEIKGRDGSVTKKYGYKDIIYSLPFFFFDNVPFKSSFRHLKPILFNAKTLAMPDDLDVYYKIKTLKINEAESDIENFGMFAVDFTLDPFQYEVENEPVTVTSRTLIKNNGHKTLPIITAQVSGTGKIYVNEQEITVKNVNGSITIDSMMQNAYRKSPTGLIAENMNKHMIGHFPVLRHGDNVVEFSSDIERLEVILNKRWR